MKQCQIYMYTQYNKNITFLLREHNGIIYITAEFVPLVQHINMCTGSLREAKKKQLLRKVNTTRSSEVFKYAVQTEAVKNNILRIHLYNYIHLHKRLNTDHSESLDCLKTSFVDLGSYAVNELY